MSASAVFSQKQGQQGDRNVGVGEEWGRKELYLKVTERLTTRGKALGGE